MQEIQEYSYNSHLLNSFSEKVDTRIKELHRNRQILIGINSIEEFVLSKIKLTQFYFDIEDDLREMLQKYKSLFINCKELQEKNHSLSSTLRNFEIKNLNLEKIQNDFKQNINDLVSQIGFLKEKQLNSEDYIAYLEEKVRITERNLGTRNNSLIDDFANNRQKSFEYAEKTRNSKNNERNLYDLNYNGNRNNGNNNFYKDRRNLNNDNDRNVSNQGHFVERFLSIFKNKSSIQDENNTIDNNSHGNNLNLNYENLYNKTAEENRSEANLNIISNNPENNKREISKTIDYKENEKVINLSI